MLRGTRVGQAYVALTVDGGDLDAQVADAFNSVDTRKIGDKKSEEFFAGIDERMKQYTIQFDDAILGGGKDNKLGLDQLLKNDDELTRQVREMVGNAFDAGTLETLIKHAGEKLGQDFGDGVNSKAKATIAGGILDSLDDTFQRAARSGQEASSVIEQALQKLNGEKDIHIISPEFLKAIDEGAKAGAAYYAEQEAKQAQFEADMLASQERLQKAEVDRLTLLAKADDKLRVAKERAQVKYLDTVIKSAEAQKKANYKALDQTAAKYARFVDQANKSLSKIQMDPKTTEQAFGRLKKKIDQDIRDLSQKVSVVMDVDLPYKERAEVSAQLAAAAHGIKMTLDKNSVAVAAAKVKAARGDGEKSVGERGNLFEKGPRNNAINLFGVAVGKTAGIIENFIRVGKQVPVLMGRFADGFKNAEQGASLLSKLGSGFGEAGLSASKFGGAIARSGPAAVAVLAAVIISATVLVTVMNALLAATVALAATIASALVGALIVGAAAFGAIGAAAGLAAFAFTQMTAEQRKALKADFKPVSDSAYQLGQTVLKDLIPHFKEWGKNIAAVIDLAKPLGSVMGRALGEAGDIFTKSLSGKGVQQFLDALEQRLPAITTNFSSALGGLTNGLASVFAVALPYVEEFSAYIDGLATKFANFAASTEGQNKISDFIERAIESFKSLMGFINAAGDLIGKLLFSVEGQKAGNSIFDDMTRGLRNLIAYLGEDNRLADWFDEGKKIAKILGDAIKIVVDVLGELNDSGTLDFLGDLVGFIKDAVEAFRQLPTPIKAIYAPLLYITEIGRAFGAVFVASVRAILGALSGMLGILATVVGKLADIPIIGKKFKGAESGIRSAQRAIEGVSEAMANVKSKSVSLTVTTTWIQRRIQQSIMEDRNKNILAPKPPKAGQGPLLPQYGGSYVAQPKTPKTPQDPFGGKDSDLGGGGGGGGGKTGPTKAEIAKAMRDMLESVREAMKEINKATDAKTVRENISTLVKSMRNSAADLGKLARKRANNAAKILETQAGTNTKRIAALIAGGKAVNATLADYAVARGVITKRLEYANQKLTDALALRANYKTSITDAVRSFGDLTTATAQTIDGVEQALTAKDITDNLQTRLDKIRKFQENLRILLANGLSNSAYKQILDAGVEEGSAYADALVKGGSGAVQGVNGLVGQIDAVSAQLGTAASQRLYDAGVAAAAGLVNGLNSQAAALNAAGTRLGNSIAAAVKKALGIKSPSTVMYAAMGYVGDGLAQGMDSQHDKVGRAAARLSGQIAVSPEVAAQASKPQGSVSGNGKAGIVWNGDIVTPTKDPAAVTNEVLNELAGRL